MVVTILMMEATEPLLGVGLAALAGYLLGAIPMGFLVGKAWGVDVLRHESGRTGGTNVWRATRQALPPLLTILGDILKGMAAVWLARYFLHSELAAAVAGAGAVVGHNWSCFLGWRGGAGGVVSAAALTALSPTAAAIAVPFALLALYLTRYASVGTLVVAAGGLAAVVVLALAAPTNQHAAHVVFGVASTLAVALALRPNLHRLAQGTERRITLR